MIKKVFLTTFFVQLASFFTTIIGMTVDGIVTGSFLGADALASYGLVTPFLTLITAIPASISVGVVTVAGIRLGKGDIKEMNRSFNVCYWFSFLLSVIIFALLFFLASPIAGMLGAKGEISAMLIDYLKGYSIGFPAIFLVSVMMPMLQLIGKGKVLIGSMVVMTSVNVAIDFFNVFVWHKQMFGMAFATTISYYVALVVILLFVVVKPKMLRISWAGTDAGIIKEMVSYGVPKAISLGSRNILAMFVNFLIIGISGEAMVAAFSAIMSIWSIAMSIGTGLSGTVSILAGVCAGEKDREDLIRVFNLSVKYSTIFNGICMVIIIALAGPLVSLYFKGDSGVLADARLGLMIMVTNLILFSINFCIRSYYQTMKNGMASFHAFFNTLLSTAALAFVLSRVVGIVGIWLAFPLAEVVTFVVFAVVAFLRTKGGKNRSISERLMMLPDEYQSEIEPLELSVKNEPDAVDASEKINSYMLSNKASKQTALFASVAVEEMVMNVIRYGFEESGAHSISVKMKKDDDSWILRIRDDCRLFDPEAYVKSITSDEKGSHFGIRMIYGLADDVKYLNTFKLNNLLIRFRSDSR